MRIQTKLEEERIHLVPDSSCACSSHWSLECLCRRMLRIISSPLGKIRPRIMNHIAMFTVGMDELGGGRIQDVVGMVDMQNEQTQGTLGDTMVSGRKVSII